MCKKLLIVQNAVVKLTLSVNSHEPETDYSAAFKTLFLVTVFLHEAEL